jgi:RNA polymerase sigma-70 factor (ECF subfamily)
VTLGGDGESARTDDDAALVEAHLAGDPDAFGELFRRHRDRLWAVALRTTGNPEDAADALQDALISAFRRTDSFRGDAAVTTWLHRIVVNASLDRLRRRKVRVADPLPDDLEEHAARGDVLAGPGQGADPGPEAHVLSGERRRRVLAALEELPPDQKAALVLVDMEGYPVAEAAAILEAPSGTIKSRCARGRARLAVLLSDLGPESGTTPADAASHPGDPPGGTREHTSGDPRGQPPGDPVSGRNARGQKGPVTPHDQLTHDAAKEVSRDD